MSNLNEVRRLAGLPLKEDDDTNDLDGKVESIIQAVQRLCDKHFIIVNDDESLDDDLADLSNEIHMILSGKS